MMEFKYCPNCKSELRLEGDRHVICDKCGFEFFLSPPPSVTLILENDVGEILFVKQGKGFRKGFWDVPGGFVEYHETAEQAVVREAKEETDLIVKDLTFFGTFSGYYNFKDFVYYPLTTVFTGKITPEQSKHIKPADDVVDYRFFKKTDIPWDKIAYADVKQALEKYVSLH